MLFRRSFLLSLLAISVTLRLFAQPAPIDDDAYGPPLDTLPGTGLEFDEAAYRAVPYKAPVTADTYANLPRAASLEQFTPTPGNQGPYSTCTAWAVAYHARTMLHGIERGITNRPQLDRLVFSPSFVYEKIKSPDAAPDCKSGTSIVNALELLRTSGVPPYSYVPYSCGATINTDAVRKATEFPIVDYQILFASDLPQDDPFKLLAIKKSLSEGSPVLIGFIVQQSFYRAGVTWNELDTDAGATGQHGRHAMVVVGYDDTKFGGAMRVMNSWGTKWGDQGFVWIPYADFNRNVFMAMQAYGKRPERQPYNVTPDNPVGTLPPLLAGEMRFEERDGTPMRARLAPPLAEGETQTRYLGYRLERSYASGTRFRFYVKTSTQAYLYAFATDLTGEITQILPFADNMSPLIGPDSTIAFPSERKVVRMDTTPGTDYLLLLYSEERLDLDALVTAMNANNGTLSLKIHQALGRRIVADEFIEKAPDRIAFSLTDKTAGTVIPLMIEIPHH
ncbi:C1 family peptidase [Actomonas aquatica]|uniref:DUF4384 domain-containing protein n=1 Tax=Actomonas aquatica TaxID=2866162 RepID=A0ABZ1C654_9BACT|nr:C1 family peptidase [Opitutus sp. WL0086]WRQ87130.1 DUF4384 domain-containing protein [Opitutus sp. WL0086]